MQEFIREEEESYLRSEVGDRGTFIEGALWVLSNYFCDGLSAARSLGRKRHGEYMDKFYENMELTPEVIVGLPSDIGSGLYERVRRELFDRYEFSVQICGHYPESNQWGLRVAFDQNVSFEKQLGILDFVEFLKPLEFKHAVDRRSGIKARVIGIMEETCSERGVYSIVIEEGVWRIVKTVYGLTRTVQEFSDPRECLRYVYDNLPYRRVVSEEYN